MICLDLSSHERSVLIEVLEGVLSDLRIEIADTDQTDWKEGLKARRAVLVKVREALGMEVATP